MSTPCLPGAVPREPGLLWPPGRLGRYAKSQAGRAKPNSDGLQVSTHQALDFRLGTLLGMECVQVSKLWRTQKRDVRCCGSARNRMLHGQEYPAARTASRPAHTRADTQTHAAPRQTHEHAHARAQGEGADLRVENWAHQRLPNACEERLRLERAAKLPVTVVDPRRLVRRVKGRDNKVRGDSGKPLANGGARQPLQVEHLQRVLDGGPILDLTEALLTRDNQVRQCPTFSHSA